MRNVDICPILWESSAMQQLHQHHKYTLCKSTMADYQMMQKAVEILQQAFDMFNVDTHPAPSPNGAVLTIVTT